MFVVELLRVREREGGTRHIVVISQEDVAALMRWADDGGPWTCLGADGRGDAADAVAVGEEEEDSEGQEEDVVGQRVGDPNP
jgi:hypothetical protein